MPSVTLPLAVVLHFNPNHRCLMRKCNSTNTNLWSWSRLISQKWTMPSKSPETILLPVKAMHRQKLSAWVSTRTHSPRSMSHSRTWDNTIIRVARHHHKMSLLINSSINVQVLKPTQKKDKQPSHTRRENLICQAEVQVLSPKSKSK